MLNSSISLIDVSVGLVGLRIMKERKLIINVLKKPLDLKA